MTDDLIVLEGLEGHAPTEFGPIQKALEPHYATLETLWWVVMCVVALVVVRRLYVDWKKS